MNAGEEWRKKHEAYIKMMDVPKKNSYEFFCLHHDMENMGFLFEHCREYFKRLYKIRADEIVFMQEFLKSYCREAMELGHPRLVFQAAIDTLEDYIEGEWSNDPSHFKMAPRKHTRQYPHYMLYWVGWTYAYIHFRHDMLTNDIIKFISLEDMMRMYPTGHQMDITNVYERATEVLPEVGYCTGKR